MRDSIRPQIISTLEQRFQHNAGRHKTCNWLDVANRLHATPKAVAALEQMEASGGEPDVIGQEDGRYLFVDCAPESPAGRRSLCFDRAALDARKANKPAGSVVEMAEAMGVTLLDERLYRQLQTLGAFDLRSSSWIATPVAIRNRGGALFCDRRYDHVFVYHNGAESYYAARGFRALLRL